MNRHTVKRTMAIAVVLLSASFAQNEKPAARVDRMTYAQAEARIPNQILPDFWIGDVKGLASRFEHLERGTMMVLGTTPGGQTAPHGHVQQQGDGVSSCQFQFGHRRPQARGLHG